MIKRHIVNNGSDLGVIVPIDRMDSPLTVNCIEHIKKTHNIPYDLVAVESHGDEFRYGKSANVSRI
jgi:hypothetical protein